MLQEFTQELKNVVLDILRGVHTVIMGKIVTYDPDKNLASILPDGKFKKPDGSMMDYPKLNKVPVYIMQGSEQTATFVYPIKKDDECIILFSEQALDTWLTKAKSDTDLKFDLSNAVAVVGMFAKPNPLIKEACKDNSIIIEKDGERVRLHDGYTYIKSKHPIGIDGTNTLLGANVLQVFFDDIIKAVTRNPLIIPPVPLPAGAPVPPVPPLINMHLNGVWTDIVAAANKAKAACAKSLK